MVSVKLVIAWIVVYTVIAFAVSKYYGDDDTWWNISGPMLTLRSQYGLDTIRYMAKKGKSFWSGWGVIGVILALLTSVISLITVTLSAYGVFLQPDATGIQGPTDLVVIPGVNRFLPVSAAPELVVALIIAMVVHELGHAIYCVLGDININATGVILGAFIPVGAFVEPDEEEQNEAETLDQLKMYAAGITNNYAVFVVSIVALFILVPMLISPITGVAVGSVFPNSPADQSELSSGDVITEVNGVEVDQPQQINEIASEGGISNVTTNNGENYEITNGAYVSRASNVSGINVSSTVVQVNGEDVVSSSSFDQYLSQYDENVAEVTYSNGDTGEIYVGLHLTGQEEDNELSSVIGLGRGESSIIFSVNDQKVTTEQQFKRILDNHNSQTVNITYLSEGEIETTTYEVSDSEFNSVIFADNPSSISTANLGIDLFPKDQYYNTLSFDDTVSGTLSNVYRTVFLPIISIVPGASFGLPGFTPFVQNFYTVGAGGGFVSSIVFFLISVIFWTSWININLAVFNCLPTFTLDGGHMVKAIVWRLPFDLSESSEIYIIRTIKLIALLPLLGLIVGPLVL